jgi:endonuclease/exonuclease/phosphatase family metal-dependent hydrolase
MRRGVLSGLLIFAVSCAGTRVASVPGDIFDACRRLVDGSGRATQAETVWRSPEEKDDRLPLARSCVSVGPGVFAPPAGASAAAIDDLVIVSWNTHVGGGDLTAFVSDLRAGRFTDDQPVRNFVLLLQEVFRAGRAVPSAFPAGRWIPDRIEVRPPGGDRDDVVTAARALGLGLFYLPSMRNGAETGERAEDRGNAILSSLALADLEAIELPFTRQRRVAVAATVAGVDSSGRPWRLRVASGHLDASTGARRLWLGSTRARAEQAQHLARALSGREPAVLGSDLNTWAAGTGEPAYGRLRREFPDSLRPDAGTGRFGLTLDYLFLRLPHDWRGDARTIADDFGSDHRPIVGRIRFSQAWDANGPSLTRNGAEHHR